MNPRQSFALARFMYAAMNDVAEGVPAWAYEGKVDEIIDEAVAIGLDRADVRFVADQVRDVVMHVVCTDGGPGPCPMCNRREQFHFDRIDEAARPARLSR